MVQQMKKLIERAGKKSYTLVMGRPSAAKLANFPEVVSNLNFLLFLVTVLYSADYFPFLFG